MAGILKGAGKTKHIHVAQGRIFGQGFKDDLLDLGWDLRMLLAQRGRLSQQVLAGEFGRRSAKGATPTEPLIDHHRQSVLVTGRAGLPLNLFGRHVGQRAEALPHLQRLVCAGGEQSQAEITEQHLVSGPQQQILRLEIAMEHVLIVRVL